MANKKIIRNLRVSGTATLRKYKAKACLWLPNDLQFVDLSEYLNGPVRCNVRISRQSFSIFLYKESKSRSRHREEEI